MRQLQLISKDKLRQTTLDVNSKIENTNADAVLFHVDGFCGNIDFVEILDKADKEAYFTIFERIRNEKDRISVELYKLKKPINAIKYLLINPGAANSEYYNLHIPRFNAGAGLGHSVDGWIDYYYIVTRAALELAARKSDIQRLALCHIGSYNENMVLAIGEAIGNWIDDSNKPTYKFYFAGCGIGEVDLSVLRRLNQYQDKHRETVFDVTSNYARYNHIIGKEPWKNRF
jgi:hypothetical protein